MLISNKQSMDLQLKYAVASFMVPLKANLPYKALKLIDGYLNWRHPNNNSAELHSIG